MREDVLTIARGLFESLKQMRVEFNREIPFMCVLFNANAQHKLMQVPRHLDPNQRSEFVRLMAIVEGAEYVMVISEAWYASEKSFNLAEPASLESVQKARAAKPANMGDWPKNERAEVLMGTLDGHKELVQLLAVIEDGKLKETTERHEKFNDTESKIGGRLSWLAPTHV